MTVTIHGIPKLSETMPKPLVQKVGCQAIRTSPPMLKASNILWPDSTSSSAIEIAESGEHLGRGVHAIGRHDHARPSPERGVHDLVLPFGRGVHALGGVREIQHRQRFRADGFLGELERFFSAAVEEQIGFETHWQLLVCRSATPPVPKASPTSEAFKRTPQPRSA
jgi:hypothetical protein